MRAKMVPKWVPNPGFWGVLGGPVGSWGGPGGSRASLRLLGTVLVDLGAVLGPSGTGLGAILGRLGGPGKAPDTTPADIS